MNQAESRREAEAGVELGSSRLTIRSGGEGRPLLVLHDEMGYPGWLRWQTEFAAERKLYIPLAPGFGIAPRVEWISSVRDLACLYARWLRQARLPPIDVVGFSLGGWIAAEMAASDPALFRRMVLVAPLGIRPTEGVILDAFELTHRAQLEATVLDPAATPEFDALYGGAPTPEQMEAFDDARAESARLAWQPYLHNPSLPFLLEGVGEQVPTLLVHGVDDRVVPFSAIEGYARALAGARVVRLERCGHRPEIEQREAFLATLRHFLD